MVGSSKGGFIDKIFQVVRTKIVDSSENELFTSGNPGEINSASLAALVGALNAAAATDPAASASAIALLKGLLAQLQGGIELTGRNLQDSVTIANGETESTDFVDLSGKSLTAIKLPDTWDGGNISIYAVGSANGSGTYVPVYDADGTAITLVVGGGARIVSLTGSQLQAVAPLQFIKLVAASAVGADRLIGLIAKG